MWVACIDGAGCMFAPPLAAVEDDDDDESTAAAFSFFFCFMRLFWNLFVMVGEKAKQTRLFVCSGK